MALYTCGDIVVCTKEDVSQVRETEGLSLLAYYSDMRESIAMKSCRCLRNDDSTYTVHNDE